MLRQLLAQCASDGPNAALRDLFVLLQPQMLSQCMPVAAAGRVVHTRCRWGAEESSSPQHADNAPTEGAVSAGGRLSPMHFYCVSV